MPAQALLLAFPATQVAPAEPSFATTLTPAAVASQLDGRRDYIVVAASPQTQALASAASALEGALREGEKAGLVMNGKSLGPIAELEA